MFILRVTAKDQPGIVAAVATALSNAECNIEESSQFHDAQSAQFFMRVVFSPVKEGAEKQFQNTFTAIADQFSINWRITPIEEKTKALILVSKEDHCLNDLLYRARRGSLNIDICGVASNHTNNQAFVEERNLLFHHLPITPQTKEEQEKRLEALISETGADLIIMARYMQILTDAFCTKYTGRIINIHHSFLPGFKGAKPYHQAYERGVKIIGATAHFATADLDEGPIIAQEILPIDHSYTPQKLQAVGRDVECRTLARAVELYTQSRIFTHSGRTVIL